MRIISGIYKGRRFSVPKNFRARPTTDFAKENLFNVINNLINLNDIIALDLFSGTGSISFELISRGCKEVVCVEKDFVHYAFIKKVAAELKTEVLTPIKKDVFSFINTHETQYDFIFADPPFALKNLNDIPGLIFGKKLLKKEGLFILEHPDTYDFSSLPGFYQRRTYGSVNFSLFMEQ
jgi:N6-adenine-specific methylase